jgi:hypothetical protein
VALKTSLSSVWELNEASGNALDSHGTNPMTETSGTIAAAAGPAGLSGSREFASADTEFFTCASVPELQCGDRDWFVSAWVYLNTSAATTQSFVSKWGAAGSREYILYCQASRFNLIARNAADGAQTIIVANTFGAPSLSTWYLVQAWHDAANDQLGICINNGTPDVTAHAGGVRSSAQAVELGVNAATNYFNGRLAQAAFWTRLLDSTDRGLIYNGGSGLPYSSWDGTPAVPLSPQPIRRRRFFR